MPADVPPNREPDARRGPAGSPPRTVPDAVAKAAKGVADADGPASASRRAARGHVDDQAWDEAQRIADLAIERQLLEPSQLRFLQKLHSDLANAGSHKTLYQVLEASKIIAAPDLQSLREEVRRSKPQRLADYELLAQLGQGATGQMYRAKHVGRGTEAALRVLSPALVSDPDFVEAFLAGGRAASKLSHPHLVRTLEVGNDHGTYYVVSEIVEGESLEQSIVDHGPLQPLEALQVAEHVLLALTYIHQEGQLHLHIRPENILLDNASKITRLADTGHAKPPARRDRVALEAADAAAHRPTYAAPEQIFSSHSGDARTDLYSLGACLYFALTGQPPLTSMELARLSLERGVRVDPRKLNPELSSVTAEFVQWLMAWLPADRPADAQAALKKLVHLLAQLKTQLKKSSRVDVTASSDRGQRQAADDGPARQPSLEKRRKSKRLPVDIQIKNRTTVLNDSTPEPPPLRRGDRVVLPKYVLFAMAIALGMFLGGILAAAIVLLNQ